MRVNQQEGYLGAKNLIHYLGSGVEGERRFWNNWSENRRQVHRGHETDYKQFIFKKKMHLKN